MYKIYLKQAWALLKENKLLSLVSIFGTALAICMIMVIVIVWQVRTANYSPETSRDRMLFIRHARATLIENNDWNNGGLLSSHVIKECFYPLPSAEAVGMAYYNMNRLVALADHTVEFGASVRYTDANFWKLFQFRFLSGKPYTEEAVRSGIMDAVVSESVARKLYGTADVVGKTVEVGYVPYTIRAVVEDVSFMAQSAYGDVWLPYTSDNTLHDNSVERLMGAFRCYILARSSSDFAAIKREVNQSVDRLNAGQGEWALRLGGQPDTQLESLARESAFEEVDTGKVVGKYVLMIAILMLIPAINMSGLTQSRMRKRMSEIGVRKAFGATGGELMRQVLLENFLQTLLGGLLGFVLSYMAVLFLSDWLLDTGTIPTGLGRVIVNAEMLFNPLIFLCAFAACMALNLLSAGLPAWRASRRPIISALNEQ